jgi:HSP20 family protein
MKGWFAMTVATRSVFRELETMRDRLDRLFSEFTPGSTDALPLDVQETEKDVIVKATMAGYKPEEITIEAHNGVLTIAAESRQERTEEQGTWHVRERRFGSVYRTIALPVEVASDKAEAKLADGVLTITLPKSAKPEGKKIEVKTA